MGNTFKVNKTLLNENAENNVYESIDFDSQLICHQSVMRVNHSK